MGLFNGESTHQSLRVGGTRNTLTDQQCAPVFARLWTHHGHWWHLHLFNCWSYSIATLYLLSYTIPFEENIILVILNVILLQSRTFSLFCPPACLVSCFRFDLLFLFPHNHLLIHTSNTSCLLFFTILIPPPLRTPSLSVCFLPFIHPFIFLSLSYSLCLFPPCYNALCQPIMY